MPGISRSVARTGPFTLTFSAWTPTYSEVLLSATPRCVDTDLRVKRGTQFVSSMLYTIGTRPSILTNGQ
jgi:hypothetical protein